MLRRWRIFGDFFASCISASRVQHLSDLHPKFAVRPHHVWKYGRLLGEKKDRKKKERKKKKPQDKI